MNINLYTKSFGREIAEFDKSVLEIIKSKKNNTFELKETITKLKNFNTSNNASINSLITILENNLENIYSNIDKQIDALYQILEYLNNIHQPEFINTIMNKIKELEENKIK